MTETAQGRVVAVCIDKGHHFSKPVAARIRLLPGLGVEGDAHLGEKVKHLYLVRKDPEAPNLRQVHLMHRELFDEVGAKGFTVKAGELGENITTEGIDLPNLPVGTKLHLGSDAIVEITGARKPCHQIDKFQQGLLHELLDKSGETLRSKSGIMGIVLAGGDIAPGDVIRVEPPQGPHRPLPLI